MRARRSAKGKSEEEGGEKGDTIRQLTLHFETSHEKKSWKEVSEENQYTVMVSTYIITACLSVYLPIAQYGLQIIACDQNSFIVHEFAYQIAGNSTGNTTRVTYDCSRTHPKHPEFIFDILFYVGGFVLTRAANLRPSLHASARHSLWLCLIPGSLNLPPPQPFFSSSPSSSRFRHFSTSSFSAISRRDPLKTQTSPMM